VSALTSSAVVAACETELQSSRNRMACNYFVQAVCARFGLETAVAGNANAIAARIGGSPFIPLATSADAAAKAASDGYLVIAAAAGTADGHVAIIVPGPLKTYASGTWPLGYWGALTGQWSGKNNTRFPAGDGPDYINFGFNSEMRAVLRYGALRAPAATP